MEIQYFLIIGGSLSLSIYLGRWIYVGALYLKWWICDEERIDYCDMPFSKWINKSFAFGGNVDHGIEWFLMCIILTMCIMILSAIAYFPIGRMIVGTVSGLAALIFTGSHTLRWAMRTKKALSKVKNLSHEHEEV